MIGLGAGAIFTETVKKFLDAECVERGSEEYRRDISTKIFLGIEVGIHTLYKFKIFAEFVGILLSDKSVYFRELTLSISMRSLMVCFEGVKRSSPCS